MSVRILGLAAALTMGLGSAAMAQSIGVYTPFGGVGIEGPSYGYAYDRYHSDRSWRGARGAYAYAPEAYAYSPGADVYVADPVVMYPPSNLHWGNPNANPNIRSGYSIPAQDNYRSEMGINSH